MNEGKRKAIKEALLMLITTVTKSTIPALLSCAAVIISTLLDLDKTASVTVAAVIGTKLLDSLA